MKARIVVMALILLVLSVLPFVLTKKDGTALLKLPEISSTLSTEETRQTFYKWQSADGQWHFGDEVPDGAEAVAVDVDTAANIIQSVKTAEKTEEPASGQPAPAGGLTPLSAAPVPGFPMTVNPADIPALIESAKQVQGLADERARQAEQTR